MDYSEKGAELEVLVAGRLRSQTVIYSSVDHEGEKWYYTKEGHQYILDARRKRASQRFVLRYLDKIPVLVRQPIATGRDINCQDNYFYFGEITVLERGRKNQKRLCAGRTSGTTPDSGCE